MSQENVESFKRFVKAWNHDDFDAWIDQLDSEEILRGATSEKDVRAVPTDDLAVIVIGAGPAGVVEAEYSALDAALARTDANELSGAA